MSDKKLLTPAERRCIRRAREFGLELRRDVRPWGVEFTLEYDDYSESAWWGDVLLAGEVKYHPIFRSKSLAGIKRYLDACERAKEVKPDALIQMYRGEVISNG
jgi:hypothetical protein